MSIFCLFDRSLGAALCEPLKNFRNFNFTRTELGEFTIWRFHYIDITQHSNNQLQFSLERSEFTISIFNWITKSTTKNQTLRCFTSFPKLTEFSHSQPENSPALINFEREERSFVSEMIKKICHWQIHFLFCFTWERNVGQRRERNCVRRHRITVEEEKQIINFKALSSSSSPITQQQIG